MHSAHWVISPLVILGYCLGNTLFGIHASLMYGLPWTVRRTDPGAGWRVLCHTWCWLDSFSFDCMGWLSYTFKKCILFSIFCFSSLLSSFFFTIQSTVVISTSVISNNRLSRRKNLVLVITQKSKIRLENIVEKRRNCSWGEQFLLFSTIFSIYISI